ncbi:MAG: glycosyltransferase [Acidimicrobiales bacterium]
MSRRGGQRLFGWCWVVMGATAVGAAMRRRARRSRTAVDRRPAGPRPRAPGTYRLSVVVPAYHEANRIADTVARLKAALAVAEDGGPVEVVVVDDGSGDGTADRARAAAADQVLVLPANRGKGAAVRAGVLAARGRTIAFIDADLSYRPEQLLKLLTEVEGGFDVVVGSRQHAEATTDARGWRVRNLSSRVFNVLTLAILLGRYRDTQCGIKAFRSDVARLLFSRGHVDGFAFDVELFHLVEHYGLTLREVPVDLSDSDRSTVRLGPEAVRMLSDLWRMRRWARRGCYDRVEGCGAPMEAGASRPVG